MDASEAGGGRDGLPLPNRNLLVVSDLHLSEGRNSRTGLFSLREDFFFDEQFARFLEHYRDTRPSSQSWHLIINGDFVDFLQVVTRRGASPDMKRDSDRPWYGLACGERESAYKMTRVARGHERFMRALAAFVAAGNAVTIIKGNHDVEFHYPAVRQALIAEIERAWRSERAGGMPPPGTVENIAAGVQFSDWFYYEKDLLWVEHGTQYEALNAFKYWLSPLLPEVPAWPPARRDEIDLPLGSLFVRYLFNRVENVEPFADNMKPATRFIPWIFCKHPCVALRFLARDGSYMLGKVRRSLRDLGPSAYSARKKAHEARLAELADRWGIPREKLGAVDGLRERALLQELPRWLKGGIRPLLAPWCSIALLTLLVAIAFITALLAAARVLAGALPPVLAGAVPQALRDSIRLLGPWAVLAVLVVAGVLLVRWALTGEEKAKPGLLAARAGEIARLLPVQYVVMGHTHEPELRRLGSRAGRHLEYFNTGSWTKILGDDRDRLLGGDVRFVFLEGVRRSGGLRLNLMQWHDEAGEPRLLELFDR